MNKILKSKRLGFIGAGNMTNTMLRGILEAGVISVGQITVSNRTVGKLVKLNANYGVNTTSSNEQVIEDSDIIILSVKPQDLLSVIEPIASAFYEGQIVVSVAAGIRMETLEKHLPQCRIVRVIPNTPSLIGQGVIGYFPQEDAEPGLNQLIEALFNPMGQVLQCETEDQLEALLVGCSSGTGFVYELMMYFQDWLNENGFDSEIAEKMTIDTFLGAAMLASQSKETLEELQAKVTSKKGVTAAGLQSMRELEIERALRISLEKAALRNKELAKEYK
ncbi:MAG: pyrroline-5-carboxylate reductase [Bdellovibrionia bacterium]